ncbi:hypothetical protein P3L10_030305 [Capsicum annuum]
MTLLLGPPSSGKTTLLLALAGKLDPALKVTGETLEFSARCQGVGSRFEMLTGLSKREKAAYIKPDPHIDIYMKILGLDICADTMVGDEMIRGISGGQKKRVTTGEMLVGPSKGG